MEELSSPNRMPILRVLIADDEPAARALLRSLLGRIEYIEVVAEVANGEDAVTAIRATAPDLLLLDVQMPGLDGFGIAERVGTELLPPVIFVTAYDQYAVKAFEFHAVDYVLKPVDDRRLMEAIERARETIAKGTLGDLQRRIASLLNDLGMTHSSNSATDRLVIKTDGRHIFIDPNEIDYIVASDKLVTLHIGSKTRDTRTSMNDIETRLSPESFVRIHRSTIVNISRIMEMQPWFQGDYVLIMRDGRRLTTGRAYRSVVRRLLNNEKSPPRP